MFAFLVRRIAIDRPDAALRVDADLRPAAAAARRSRRSCSPARSAIRPSSRTCARRCTSTSRCRFATCTGSSGVLHGDLGESLRMQKPVLRADPREAAGDARARGASRSSSRSRSAFPPASSRRVKRNTAWDYGANAVALWGLSTPNFWLGIMLILLFSVHARLAAGVGLREPVRGLEGQPRGADHAGVRARQRDRRRADAPHAERDAAGAVVRLRAHGAREGARRARRHPEARAAQRADPGRSRSARSSSARCCPARC